MNCSYCGVDITPEFIKELKEGYETIKSIKANIVKIEESLIEVDGLKVKGRLVYTSDGIIHEEVDFCDYIHKSKHLLPYNMRRSIKKWDKLLKRKQGRRQKKLNKKGLIDE